MPLISEQKGLSLYEKDKFSQIAAVEVVHYISMLCKSCKVRAQVCGGVAEWCSAW